MLDVAEIQQVMERFGTAVDRHAAELNALNVFPVADADTGSNMGATLRAINAALLGASSRDEASQRVERAALSGRGNSGLILGQFLAGFLSVADLADSLGAAAARARASIAHPAEGTMISVADAIADRSPGALLEAATFAVDQTTSQLPALAAAGVVDSGAAGLWLFVAALEGADPVLPARWLRPPAEGADPQREIVGYEIQFLCERAALSPKALRDVLESVGTDVVVGATEEMLSAHVHVVDDQEGLAALRSSLSHTVSAEHESTISAVDFRIEPLLTPVGDAGSVSA